MDLEQLQTLRNRVAQATGPDRHADTLIAHSIDGWTIKKIGGKPHFSHPEEVPIARDGKPSNYPSYTSSIDAALAWVERALPGAITIHAQQWKHPTAERPESWTWELSNYPNGRTSPVYASTPALAIILAGLDALIAKEK
jgi:hypothetical protein